MAEVLTHNQVHKSPQDALAHYGVKGMRWGVRKKDDPAKDTPAGSDKRAAKYEANAQKFQKEIDAIQAKPTPRLKMTQRSRDKQVAELSTFRDEQQKAADDIRSGRTLTDAQRKAAIGLGVAGALVASYGAYKFVDSGQANALMSNSPWKKNEKLSQYSSPDDIYNNVVKQVNPGYGAYGTKMNCRRCTFAYELRRRGYDVKATKSNAGTGQTVGGMLNATTPGAKNATTGIGLFAQVLREGNKEGGVLSVIEKSQWGEKSIAAKDDNMWAMSSQKKKSSLIYDALKKEPVGSRGELGVGWTMGGGHSMAYEIFKDRVVIFDAQSGKRYDTPSAFEEFANVVTAAGFTRLDNKTLNDDFLRSWIQDVD